MTQQDLRLLAHILEKLENSILISDGLKNISGGFAKAEMFDFDNDIIDIELKSGVISDYENHVYTENIKLDRKTFNIIN